MTIHRSDPFGAPEPARSPVRRLRGRLPAAVTLWTATHASGDRAGLTVSSTVVVDGSPGSLLGLIDDESSLWEAVESSGRFVLTPLYRRDWPLADAFAGLRPAPGGPFRGHDWVPTRFGPVPAGHPTWAGCQLERARPVGWSLLVEARVDHVEIDPSAEDPPLVHYRGRYRTTG